MRRAHGQQDKVGAFVAELHDRKADQQRTVTGDQRHGVAVVHGAADAFGLVLPAESGLDQVARHQRDGLRIVMLGDPEGDGRGCHGIILPQAPRESSVPR